MDEELASGIVRIGWGSRGFMTDDEYSQTLKRKNRAGKYRCDSSRRKVLSYIIVAPPPPPSSLEARGHTLRSIISMWQQRSTRPSFEFPIARVGLGSSVYTYNRTCTTHSCICTARSTLCKSCMNRS
uniref:Uncharacterized protein n=1 Tax=Trichogramma kaykai TaxID=54128 RepID=A0ABD2WD07_9HYME